MTSSLKVCDLMSDISRISVARALECNPMPLTCFLRALAKINLNTGPDNTGMNASVLVHMPIAYLMI
eukprot:11548806-Karenia_brevis.AAC.1